MLPKADLKPAAVPDDLACEYFVDASAEMHPQEYSHFSNELMFADNGFLSSSHDKVNDDAVSKDSPVITWTVLAVNSHPRAPGAVTESTGPFG
ncbi:hypothetical protein ElyMa_000319500 [Elysia marginata]|uniref:Uncharacterized protein n=1 Tax=Elysia marginata TaxID=1093978 RepID=A0AAV4FA28_9GAST|nr:hypothetical protein ElyMa_000319500 [Elysia marginata]